jgi:hypothetical protein
VEVDDYRRPKASSFPEGFLEKTRVDPGDEWDLDDLARIFARTEDGLRIMDVNRIPWKQQYESRREEISKRLEDVDAGLEALKPYVINL